MRYSYIILLLLLIFLSACSSKNVVGGSDELRPLAGSPNLPDCHPAIGWEEIDAAPNNNIVFFGELHGTVEGPAHVGEYLCAVASSGKSVALALEIPNSFSDGLMLGWPRAGAASREHRPSGTMHGSVSQRTLSKSSRSDASANSRIVFLLASLLLGVALYTYWCEV